MAKVTQAGLAFELYSENKNIKHEEFVERFLKIFPEQTPYIAALYWQNKARRAKFGLASLKLPEIYKDTPKQAKVKVAKEPKPKKVKEPKIKVVDHSASNRLIAKFVASEAGKPYAGTKTVAANGRNIDQGTIDAIKAKNLARLKSVSKKYAPGQVARPQGPGVPNFNPDQARAEVAAMYSDMDEEERKRDYPTKLSYTDTEQLTGINPGSYD